ncbi:MAG: PDZ domain-containing protein [Steroidobacter sp.]
MNAFEFRWGPSTLAAAVLVSTMLTGATAIAAEAGKKSAASQAELEQKLEAAQKRLDTAAREVADLSMSLSDHFVPHMRALRGMRAQRAMLGVNLGRRDDGGPDDGVTIASVSPGGAAAEAGLKADDVLLELNGKALKREGGDSPREKLLSAMDDVKPGDALSVRYRRDGKVNTVKVIAQSPVERMFTMPLPMRGVHGPAHLPHMSFMRAEGVFGSAELVPLTPKLGQYFGTDKGLLVVRAPGDARLKLEDGDVIVDIDGRTPSSPSHALRILGSYQPGEKLKLNVLRAKKRMAFDITIPEDWESQRDRFEGSFVPAVPAQPLIAPAPPAPPAPPGPGGGQSI